MANHTNSFTFGANCSEGGVLQVPGRGGGNIKINSKMAYFEPRPRVVCFIGDVAPLKVNIFLTENMRNFLTIVTQFLDLKSKR